VKFEKGNVLLYVVVISFVVSVIAVTVISAVVHFTKTVDKVSQIDLIRQQNSAALRAAIEEVKKYDDINTLPASMTFMNKVVLIEVEQERDGVWNQLKLSVQGSANDSTLTVEQHVKKAPPYPFMYSLYANDTLNLSGIHKVDITGSPYALYGRKEIKAMTTFSKPSIEGWISYSDPNAPVVVKDHNKEDLKMLAIENTPFPQLKDALAKQSAQKNGCYYAGISLRLETPGINLNCGQVKYIDGNLLLQGNVQIDGLLIVNGTLRFIGDATLTSGQNGLIIVSKNTEVLAGIVNNITINGVLYTPGNFVGLIHNLNVNGSIVANVINVQDIKIKYSQKEVGKIPVSLWRYFSNLEVDTFGWTESIQSR
jgi:hypothetical protein